MTTSLFSVRKNGRFGYVNKSGDIVVDIRYDNATAFSEGLGCLNEGELTHVIDHTGKILFSMKDIEPVSCFCNQYLVASRDNKYGIINRLGEVVVDFTFDLISGDIYHEMTNAVADNNFGLLHTNGDWISKFEWGIIAEWQSDSQITSVEDRNTKLVHLINRDGKYVSDRSFAQGWSHSCGVLPVEFMPADGGGVGLVDSTGAAVVNGLFQSCNSHATNGTIAVEGSGKWGVIDTSGNWLCPPKYAYIREEYCGLRATNFGGVWVGRILQGGQWGYITSIGEVAIEPQYRWVLNFADDVAAVHAGGLGKDGVSYLIDKRGRIIFESRGS